jgi:hypothetical protein
MVPDDPTYQRVHRLAHKRPGEKVVMPNQSESWNRISSTFGLMSLVEAIGPRELDVINIHVSSKLWNICLNINGALEIAHSLQWPNKTPKKIDLPFFYHDDWPEDVWFIEYRKP